MTNSNPLNKTIDHAALATDFLAAGDPRNAIEHAARALAVSPTDVALAKTMGRGLLALVQCGDAVHWLALAGDSEGMAAARAKRPLPVANDGCAIRAELDAVLAGSVTNGQSALAEILARPDLTTADRTEALLVRVRIESGTDDAAAAFNTRNQIIALDPCNSQRYVELGQELFSQSRDADAEVAFRRAIDMQAATEGQRASSRGEAEVGLGGLLLVNERFAEAEAVLRRAIALRPGDAEAHFYLCRSVMKQARPDEAREILAFAAELGSETAKAWCEKFDVAQASAWFAAGNNFLAAGDCQGAIAHLAKAEALWANQRQVAGDYFSRSLAMALSNGAFALFKLGRFAEAEAKLRQALEERPGFRDALNHLGNVLEQTDRLEPALEVFRRCATLDNDYASAPYGEAGVLERLNRLDEARAAIERALAIGYDSAQRQADLERRRDYIASRSA